MSLFLLLAPVLIGAELILLLLRWRGVLRWRCWMMTPAWIGGLLFVVELAAFASVVAVARDAIRWGEH